MIISLKQIFSSKIYSWSLSVSLSMRSSGSNKAWWNLVQAFLRPWESWADRNFCCPVFFCCTALLWYPVRMWTLFQWQRFHPLEEMIVKSGKDCTLRWVRQNFQIAVFHIVFKHETRRCSELPVPHIQTFLSTQIPLTTILENLFEKN